jgi:Terminase small subunit
MAVTQRQEIQNLGLSGGRRPSNVTAKQWRLAQLYPRCETAYEACVKAGYQPTVARAISSKILDGHGTQKAFAVLEQRRADRARGLLAVSEAALANVSNDIQDLEPRDRLALGLQAHKLAHDVGENLELRGDADRWKQRIRRACRLMARLTELRLSPPTQAQAFQEAELVDDGTP